MNEAETLEYLFSITDEQAIFSDIDGDTDCEDESCNVSKNSSNYSTPVLRCSTSEDPLSINSFDIMSMPVEIRQIENCTGPSTNSTSISNLNFCDSPKISPVIPILTKKKQCDLPQNSSVTHIKLKKKKFLPKPITYQWTKTTKGPRTFKKFKFDQPFGPNIPIDLDSPLAIFQTFFDNELFEHIKIQTELYASQNNKNITISIEEIKAFFGILIIMGFHKLPTLRSYWSNDSNFHVERISNIMSLKRFLQILRYLHINDNTKMPTRGEQNYHKLFKVLPLIQNLKKKFLNNFNPSRNISIDESMIACKGRTTLKQYMPLKPIKRGIKVWAACCAQTGYLLNFDIYQGKQGDPEIGLGERVVTLLASPFDNKGFCFYFDSFFSNIPMMNKMLEKNNFGCGTIKANKKYFPSTFLKIDKQFKQGECDIVNSKELSVSKWKDRGVKCVNVVSNMHDSQIINSVTRKDNRGDKHLVKCPISIVDYNKYMGGVDHFDQFHSFYNISWKSRRWWVKIFYYLLDASVVNSYILYKVTNDLHDPKASKFTHLQFRSALANQLIGDYTSRKQPGIKPKLINRKLNKKNGKVMVTDFYKIQNLGDHQPIKGTCRRCAYCSTKIKPKRSSILCKKCDVALCLNCFEPFHKL